MKRYKLLKDLPLLKAGQECWIANDGSLQAEIVVGDRTPNPHSTWKEVVALYDNNILRKKPSILTDWFEEIPKKPRTVDDIQVGDKYYYISSYLTPMQEVWGNTAFDRMHREIGNCYLTEEEAEKESKWQKAMAILKRDTKGFKPNWRDDMTSKWYVEYDAYMEEFDAYATEYAFVSGSLYFASKQDAIASFKAHPDEWKTYLGVEE